MIFFFSEYPCTPGLASQHISVPWLTIWNHWTAVCQCFYCTHISFSHLMVGDGSPTALQGNTMSLIQGVVTVLLKVRMRAGAAKRHTCLISRWRRCSFSYLLSSHLLSNPSAHSVRVTGSAATIWWCFTLLLSNGAEKAGYPSSGPQTGCECPKKSCGSDRRHYGIYQYMQSAYQLSPSM